MKFKTSIKDYNLNEEENWKEFYENGFATLNQVYKILSRALGRPIAQNKVKTVFKQHSWDKRKAKSSRVHIKTLIDCEMLGELENLFKELGLVGNKAEGKPCLQSLGLKPPIDLYSKHSYTDEEIKKIEKNLPKPKQIMQGSRWRTDESGRIVRQETSDKAKKPMQPKMPEKPKAMSERDREMMQMQYEIGKIFS